MNKREVLLRAALMLRDTQYKYRWNHSNQCNLAFVISAASDCSRQVKDVMLSLGVKEKNIIWAKNLEHPVCVYLKSKFGFTDDDIKSIEWLNDKRIINSLAKKGIFPAPMFNRSRKYVASYIEQMASRRVQNINRLKSIVQIGQLV